MPRPAGARGLIAAVAVPAGDAAENPPHRGSPHPRRETRPRERATRLERKYAKLRKQEAYELGRLEALAQAEEECEERVEEKISRLPRQTTSR